jgi:acyl-CoA thioesterase-1
MGMKLYFFGDSICFGQHVSINNTWIHKLAQKLENDFKDILVFNASVNGNTTRLALERMYFDVLSHRPDLLYIQFGLNDCNVWATDYGCERVSKKAYLSNILEMIDKAFAAGVKRIFLNTNHPTVLNKTFLPNRKTVYEANNKLYYHALQEFQSSLSEVISLDIRSHVEKLGIKPQSFLLEDGIHLNLLGHEIYYDYVYPFIKNEILKLFK